MRKILSVLSLLVIATSGSGLVSSCNSQPIKHEMTKENLDAFFDKNNYFSYQGPSFFKDESQQTEDESSDLWMFTSKFLTSTISKSLKEKFRNYFVINSNTFYKFEVLGEEKKNIDFIKGFKIGQESKFNFKIDIRKDGSSQLNSIYTTDWLTFSFTETKQYERNEWLKQYKNVLIDNCYSIFSTFSEPYISTMISYDIFLLKNHDTKIVDYQTDNNQEVLKNMNDKTNGINRSLLSHDGINWQFYDDKKIEIKKVNSYKYIDTMYDFYNPKKISYFFENVNITIGYVNYIDQINNQYETFNLVIGCVSW